MAEKLNRLDPYFEYGEKYTEPANEVIKLWEKYFPFWPVLLLFIGLCTGGAWLYLQYQQPIYAAKASVLIKDEKKGVDAAKMTEGLNQANTTKLVENEIEVLTSRTVVSKTVTNLRLYAPVFKQGKWTPLSAYVTSPVTIELEKPSSIQEEDKIEFSFVSEDSTIHIGQNKYHLNQWVNTKFGRLRFLSNEKSPYRTGNEHFYFSLINPKMVTKDLIEGLKLSPATKLGTVISLSLKDEVPEKAEDILNAIIDEYSRITVKNKNSLADSTLSFVQQRLDKVTHELDSVESKLQTYRSDKNAIDISSQGKLVLDNLSVNDQKVSDVDMQLAVLNQIETYLLSKNPQAEIIPSGLLVNDPILSKRLEKLSQAELEYERLRRNTGENNPMLISVTNQIERLKPGILESIKNQKLNLQAGITNLNTTTARYNKELQGIPKKERDLIEISREQTVKTGLYNFLLQKREEARMSRSSGLPDNFIVDRAEAGLEPVSPKKIYYYLSSILIACFIFIGLITANENFNSTILYRQEIEKLTTTPILAEISYEKQKNPIVIANGKTNYIAEQFRKLRSSMGYLGITGKRKKILVTSVIPGEGKSFVAVNLGMSIALADKKVLLLEFDLINPGLTNKLQMSAGIGISEYLVGNADVEAIIRQTPICENLYIISAGKDLPPNPSELILNNHTAELLDYASGIFDYIIIDTPPVSLRSDAFTLSKLCDATVYVMRHKVTPKNSLKHLDENNKVNELKNMAIVFNGIKPKGFSKNKYGYGYEYKYRGKKKNPVWDKSKEPIQ